MKYLLLVLALLGAPASATAADWYNPPGQLMGEPAGKGVSSTFIYYPGMRFPIEEGPAYLNSQIYRPGGGSYSGSPVSDARPQCNIANYSYPWEDTFCETRGRATPLCPTGKGHQGVDIRPSSCVANRHWTVAAEDGLVSNIGSYSVTLQTDQGVRFVYLHLNMDNLAVRVMQRVKKGDRIGQVSNFFAGTPTTWHLHFEIRDSVRIEGVKTVTPVPPYSSLVAAYANLMGLPQ